MPKTIVKIRTWRCPVCDYAQDFEPTQENVDRFMNHDPKYALSNLKGASCPSCALKGNQCLMDEVSDSTKKITITIAGEEDLEDINTLDEATGEKRKLSVQEKDVLKDKIRKDIEHYTKIGEVEI